MRKYRIKQIDNKYYPQERMLFFFWDNIKLEDMASRDWFVTSLDNNFYNGMATYLKAKDAWGATHYLLPEFKTLDSAKLFIEEYKKFLESEYDKQNMKYYY